MTALWSKGEDSSQLCEGVGGAAYVVYYGHSCEDQEDCGEGQGEEEACVAESECADEAADEEQDDERGEELQGRELRRDGGFGSSGCGEDDSAEGDAYVGDHAGEVGGADDGV